MSTRKNPQPKVVFLAADQCATHDFAALMLLEMLPSGWGSGTRLLGRKSCCAARRERMRWRVSSAMLRDVAAKLTAQADAMDGVAPANPSAQE